MTSVQPPEADRQAALVRWLAEAPGTPPPLRFAGSAEQVARGAAAYRGNARALADKALAAVFPTVRRLLGADAFAELAADHRAACPPVRGDLGEWGASFPEFVQAQAALARWPWLADCARLDLAVHRNERAADAVTDRASLQRLQDTDPARLHLVLVPGTAVLRSDWPIATLHRAHAEASDAAFAEARRAVARRQGESVLVVRDGWRAAVRTLDAPTCAWTEALLDGATLAAALDRAGAGFDFAAWLAQAVAECGLECIRPASAGGPHRLERDVE